MQNAARVEYDHLSWIWAMYDSLLNRGATEPFLAAARTCSHATFNGQRCKTAQEATENYIGLRGAVSSRGFKLDHVSFSYDVPIAPETFAHCASVWWLVDSPPDVPWPGEPVFGATQIFFHENKTIIRLRDIWAPL